MGGLPGEVVRLAPTHLTSPHPPRTAAALVPLDPWDAWQARPHHEEDAPGGWFQGQGGARGADAGAGRSGRGVAEGRAAL